jgi:hypothetical protein
MFVWKKQSSHVTFFVARFAGRLLCFVGTVPLRFATLRGRAGWTGRAIKAPRAPSLKGQRRTFPQIADKTISTRPACE